MTPSTSDNKKLSKKQLKANSFHNKKQQPSTRKQQLQQDPAPFPEPDSPLDETPQQQETKKRKLPPTSPSTTNEKNTSTTKKRKQLPPPKDISDTVLNPTALAKAQLRKRRKEIKKLKAEKKKAKEETEPKQQESEQGEGEEKVDETKKRFIVFVGNLPFKATKQEVEEHFKTAGDIVSCRLLTDKKTKKAKGFAFIEYKDSLALSRALHFHHTLFLKRELNVELTAGGGGSKSEARKAKIDQKRTHLEEERRNYHEKNIVPGKASKNEGKTSAESTVRNAVHGDKAAKKNTAKFTSDAVKRPSRLDGANAISLNDSNRRVIGRKEPSL